MGMNDHQLFEQWLLSEESLSKEQDQTLREHLRSCEACQQLDAGWSGVKALICQEDQLLAPHPGFTARWQARQAQEQSLRQRRQSLAMLLSMTGASFTLFILLIGQAFPVLRSPGHVLLLAIYRITTVVAITETTGEFVLSFLRALVFAVPPLFWVFFIGFLTILGVLWIVAIQAIASPRRISQ